MPDDIPAPWDEQTDLFVADLDIDATKKYDVSLRKLLLDPQSYAKTSGILDNIRKMKADVESYFDEVMSQFTVENQALEKDLEKADALYNQITQVVTSKASVARVPVIKPDNMDLTYAAPEILYITQYTPQMDALVTKFINLSNYIGDLSASYRKYMMGSWLFSGARSYIVSIKQPESPVTGIEDSHNIISALLEDSQDTLQDLVKGK